MDDASKPRTRRSVTSVDLGGLKGRVDEFCAAAGVGPSTWLRELASRELGGGTPASIDAVPESPSQRQAVYRAWLDAGLTDKLDRIATRGGFRTRAAALRGVLEGVNVGSGNSSVGVSVEALGTSNHHLVAIGRNVNQIAKALHGSGGKAMAADRIALDEAVRAIHEHLELSARLVGELRPMLKSKWEKA